MKIENSLDPEHIYNLYNEHVRDGALCEFDSQPQYVQQRYSDFAKSIELDFDLSDLEPLDL